VVTAPARPVGKNYGRYILAIQGFTYRPTQCQITAGVCRIQSLRCDSWYPAAIVGLPRDLGLTTRGISATGECDENGTTEIESTQQTRQVRLHAMAEPSEYL